MASKKHEQETDLDIKPISIRADAEQVKAWKAAAKKDDRTLSSWIRAVLNKAAKLAGVAIVAVALSGCTYVRGVRAIQPPQATDTVRVWVEITTNHDDRDGVYRCVDSADGLRPVCTQAELRR